MPVDIRENEIRFRQTNPKKYIKIRRQNDRFGIGIDVVWGVFEDESTEIQSIVFDRKYFTKTEAKIWLKQHKYKHA